MAKGKGSTTGATGAKDAAGKQSAGNKGKGDVQAAASRRTEPVMSPEDEEGELTGTADADYNLVSVLYHSLKGAQTYAQYIQDAEEAGDTELVEFFEDVQEDEQIRADRAKELLARRLGRMAGAGDGEDEDAE